MINKKVNMIAKKSSHVCFLLNEHAYEYINIYTLTYMYFPTCMRKSIYTYTYTYLHTLLYKKHKHTCS